MIYLLLINTYFELFAYSLTYSLTVWFRMPNNAGRHPCFLAQIGLATDPPIFLFKWQYSQFRMFKCCTGLFVHLRFHQATSFFLHILYLMVIRRFINAFLKWLYQNCSNHGSLQRTADGSDQAVSVYSVRNSTFFDFTQLIVHSVFKE